jgi:hypothetical protein
MLAVQSINNKHTAERKDLKKKKRWIKNKKPIAISDTPDVRGGNPQNNNMKNTA